MIPTPKLPTMTSVRRLAALGTVAATAAVFAPAPAEATTPATPSNVHVASSHAGTYLTWSAGSAGHFQIQQATDSRFRYNVRTYLDRDGRDRQLTPYALSAGHTYYWRVRAFIGSTGSHWSSSVHAVVYRHEQRVRVLTYNVIENSADGTYESGNKIAPWSQRVVPIVALIKQAAPSVIGLQEAAGWVSYYKGPRQVDDVASRLGSSFIVAHTEVRPGEGTWFRTGVYIIYNSTAWRAAAAGGHWNIGNTRWAAYQLLQNRSTGATFLFISTHLTAASGSSGDSARETEMKNLITDATNYSNGHAHAPVVYAGDFNSHDGHNHAFDGPGIATRAAHIADAFKSAQARSWTQYDSANMYMRTPPAAGRSIDHVYAAPRVAIVSWRQYLKLSNGQFVGVIPSDHNPIASDLVLPY